MINIFYLSNNTTGGWVTFTYHLVETLKAIGEECRLFKVGSRTEGFSRPFGYGLEYRNVTIEDAVRIKGPVIIAAAAKQRAEAAKALIDAGAKVVLHDPTELRAGLAGVDIKAPWVIRRAVQRQVPGSVFIRHPYIRRERPVKLPKRKGAVSVSRIDFDKHTEIILAANRLGAGIRIHGFENRLYTKFKIIPEFPEWEQSVSHYPRTPDEAFNLLLGANFMVDMSAIKGDGGGTQYTFLEAWDAGAVPVLGDWWWRKNDDMTVGNAVFIQDAVGLSKVARRPYNAEIAANGEKQLKKHAPKVIGPKIMEWLNV